ncbi:MAG: dihydropteroate synthase [Spirochaetales bacterium]|nr:dihydropteroate synthase [Spirochaetales bacterium]
MSIETLTIIGESINDSVPSTQKLFDANDIEGLKALAKHQDEKGSAYIDVNVGRRPPEFMASLVREIQSVTAKPLSIDTPDYDIAAAGLAAYDPARAGGRMPILNSISLLRARMFDLYSIKPFMPILMASERVVDGQPEPARTPREVYDAAAELLRVMAGKGYGIPVSRCIVDPGIAPIGSDTEGALKRVLESMALIHADPDMAGIHMSVGLSNFTVMLPSKRADGSPLKSVLESAFLTKAMPLGLDMIVGSVARTYRILPADHPALVCLEDCLRLEGFDVIGRVQEFYS